MVMSSRGDRFDSLIGSYLWPIGGRDMGSRFHSAGPLDLTRPSSRPD